MGLRPGALLDLTALARKIPAYQLAAELGISTGAMSNYIAGTHYIKKSAVADLATRWVNSVEPIVSDETEYTLVVKWSSTIRGHLFDLFRTAYEFEHGLRLFVDDEHILRGFAACAAHFIAPDSVRHSGDEFTFYQARQLLNAIISGTDSELAIRYLLWRIRTREGYYLDRVPPENARRETRDVWPIPMLNEADKDNESVQLADLPTRASLKKAATIDVMGLAFKISLGVNRTQPGYLGIMLDEHLEYECALTNPQGRSIIFRVHRTDYTLPDT